MNTYGFGEFGLENIAPSDLFVHFAPRDSVHVLQSGTIYAKNHNAVFAYNFDIARQTKCNATFPASIDKTTMIAVLFVDDNQDKNWWHYPEESATSYPYREQHGKVFKMQDFVIIDDGLSVFREIFN